MRNLITILLLSTVLMIQAQTVTPKKESGSKFSITCANMYFEIDSANGARITSFKLDNNEMLFVYHSGDMDGSTFWPSPQNEANGWGWPPPVNLDNKKYKSEIVGNKIKFAGSTDTETNLRFYKTMYANTTDSSIVIEYTMKNEKPAAQTWAPWEVTRVVGKGLTVFPMGDGSVTGNMASSADEIDGYVWYDKDNVSGGGGDKFFSDGRGWLAHVVDGDKLLIKKFEDIAKEDAAPGEAEIEIYSAGKTYTELENQGAYASIASKDSVTWVVKWFARTLPAAVDASAGSQSLVNYIESVLSRSTNIVDKTDTKNMLSVKVFPNPANEFLIVESTLNSYGNVSIVIFNLQGKLMLKQPISSKFQPIAISALGNGSYVFELQQDLKFIARGQLSIKK